MEIFKLKKLLDETIGYEIPIKILDMDNKIVFRLWYGSVAEFSQAEENIKGIMDVLKKTEWNITILKQLSQRFEITLTRMMWK